MARLNPVLKVATTHAPTAASAMLAPAAVWRWWETGSPATALMPASAMAPTIAVPTLDARRSAAAAGASRRARVSSVPSAPTAAT